MAERIGIFGGTFNPIHNGHMNSMLSIAKSLSLDRILLVPSFQTPGKEATESPTPQQRLEMARLASEDYQNLIEVDDTEIQRGGVSYTIDTLLNIRKRKPDAELFLIVGADAFGGFDQWKDFDKIVEIANLVVTSRPGYGFPDDESKFPKGLQKYISAFDFNYVELKTGRHVDFVKIVDQDISGTEIRRLFRAGRHVEKFVSLKVEDYIKQNHFYDPIGGKIPDFEAFAKFCANQLVEKKAANVRAFDLEGKNQPCDYSIVASGTSTKHAQSLADHVARMVKDTYGVNPLSHEGQQEGRWVLLDYGALIVHVFYDFVRDEYDLEQLWKGSRRIEV